MIWGPAISQISLIFGNVIPKNSDANITLISKPVSPICTTKNNVRNNNQSKKSCNDFSFEYAEGPEDMHFVFVKLFQKKKVFYEKLVEKIEKNKEIDIEHNNSNDFFTYE